MLEGCWGMSRQLCNNVYIYFLLIGATIKLLGIVPRVWTLNFITGSQSLLSDSVYQTNGKSKTIFVTIILYLPIRLYCLVYGFCSFWVHPTIYRVERIAVFGPEERKCFRNAQWELNRLNNYFIYMYIYISIGGGEGVRGICTFRSLNSAKM